jgi:hypothetical protein
MADARGRSQWLTNLVVACVGGVSGMVLGSMVIILWGSAGWCWPSPWRQIAWGGVTVVVWSTIAILQEHWRWAWFPPAVALLALPLARHLSGFELAPLPDGSGEVTVRTLLALQRHATCEALRVEGWEWAPWTIAAAVIAIDVAITLPSWRRQAGAPRREVPGAPRRPM